VTQADGATGGRVVVISEAPPAARGGRTSGGGDVGARRRSCTAKEIQTGRAGLRPRAATRAASAPTSLSPKDTRDSEQYRASNQTQPGLCSRWHDPLAYSESDEEASIDDSCLSQLGR
jgi:hypothetical protein